jgi:DNA repair protein RecO (recombination protein O)
VESARGIVIRTRKLTESSLIVTWCSEEWGVLKTVAKGARKARSSFAGQLDLFVEGELMWYRSRVSDLHTLKELRVTSVRQPLRTSYGRTVTAAYLGELVERAVESESAVPEVFDLLRRALDFLAEGGELHRALPFFEKELAGFLGLGRGRGYAGRLEDVLSGGFPRSRSEVLRMAKN